MISHAALRRYAETLGYEVTADLAETGSAYLDFWLDGEKCFSARISNHAPRHTWSGERTQIRDNLDAIEFRAQLRIRVKP